MALKLKGSTSGFTAIDAPAVAGDNTLVLPGGNGTSGQYLQTDGAGALSWQTVTDTGAQWTSGTAQTLSGTSQIFDSIPSNAVWIVITFINVSPNGASNFIFRIGDSAGIETTGYESKSNATSSVGDNATSTFEFNYTGDANYSYDGVIELWRHSGNTWNVRGQLQQQTVNDIMTCVGTKTLSDTLTQVEISVNPSSFDAGTATIHYLTLS
jgi:putative component of toxin-antitoxin plasmid stabilization module